MAENILPTPQTREDMYNAYLSGDNTYTVDTLPKPITRKEMYLASLCGMKDVQIPTPVSREDIYLNFIAENGGVGGGKTVTIGEYVPRQTTTTYNSKESSSPTISSGEYVAPPTESTT